MNHPTPTFRFADDRGRCATAVALALFVAAACSAADGDATEAGADSTTPGSDASSSASSDTTDGAPVICGQPGEIAATDSDIASLEGCTVYRGSVNLTSDATSVVPLSSLVVIEGELLVAGTDSPLQSLSGLENLEEVGKLTGNSHNISDLTSLSSLRAIHGKFTLLSMFNLVDVDGLQGVVAIDGDFVLLANPVLVDLDGFSSLATVGGDFEATSYMTSLPRAEAQALVDRIEVGGAVNID